MLSFVYCTAVRVSRAPSHCYLCADVWLMQVGHGQQGVLQSLFSGGVQEQHCLFLPVLVQGRVVSKALPQSPSAPHGGHLSSTGWGWEWLTCFHNFLSTQWDRLLLTSVGMGDRAPLQAPQCLVGRGGVLPVRAR